MDYQTLEHAARIGTRHGGDAAVAFFDGNTSIDTYRSVLAGINDGDPAVLDTLPVSSLYAEETEYGIDDLLSDLELHPDTGDADRAEVTAAYTDAFRDAAEETLVEIATGHVQQDAINEIDAESVWDLARRLDGQGISQPDRLDSPGAQFLTDIRDAVTEAVTSDWDMTSESAEWHDWVDPVVPVYTHQVWQTFVDLTAYQSEWAEEVGGMSTESAMSVLFYVGEDLARSLTETLRERLED